MLHKNSCYKALFNILDEYKYFSGLHVNYNKTEILRIGSLRHTDAQYYSRLPIIWTDGPIKILGIWTIGDNKEMSQINLEATLSKVRNICNVWSKRPISLLGKILVVNTIVVPNFVYRLSVTNTPSKEQFAMYKKEISKFLWDNKRAKIAYKRMCRVL